MNIFGSDMVQIDMINVCAGFQIVGHTRRRYDEVNGKGGVCGQSLTVAGGSGKGLTGRLQTPAFIELADLFVNLKEPASAWDSVGFQGRGDGQADGFLRAAAVGYHQVGGHGVQASANAFRRGVIGLQINGGVNWFWHPCILL